MCWDGVPPPLPVTPSFACYHTWLRPPSTGPFPGAARPASTCAHNCCHIVVAVPCGIGRQPVANRLRCLPIVAQYYSIEGGNQYLLRHITSASYAHTACSVCAGLCGISGVMSACSFCIVSWPHRASCQEQT